MTHLKRAASLVMITLLIAGCEDLGEARAGSANSAEGAIASKAIEDRQTLGLMTSLPLYWPLGAEFADLVSDSLTPPWQRAVLEREHELVLLDTLSPTPGLGPNDPETDPLAGLDRLAIIQPRGLSPADNVALDNWVRAGGELLIALDPVLTGHYELPLGDPRRPNDTALIPPVIARWGMASEYDPEQAQQAEIARFSWGEIPVVMGGQIVMSGADASANGCEAVGHPVIVQCSNVGKGRVTYIADAAAFEHMPGGKDLHDHSQGQPHDHSMDNALTEAEAQNAPLLKLLRFAFGK